MVLGFVSINLSDLGVKVKKESFLESYFSDLASNGFPGWQVKYSQIFLVLVSFGTGCSF